MNSNHFEREGKRERETERALSILMKTILIQMRDSNSIPRTISFFDFDFIIIISNFHICGIEATIKIVLMLNIRYVWCVEWLKA